MNSTQVVGGLGLIVVSTVLMFATTVEGSGVPVAVASLAAIGLAVGTLLVGTSKSSRV